MESMSFKYFSFRLTLDLYDWLKEQAVKHRRSMAAELLCQLEKLKEAAEK